MLSDRTKGMDIGGAIVSYLENRTITLEYLCVIRPKILESRIWDAKETQRKKSGEAEPEKGSVTAFEDGGEGATYQRV